MLARVAALTNPHQLSSTLAHPHLITLRVLQFDLLDKPDHSPVRQTFELEKLFTNH